MSASIYHNPVIQRFGGILHNATLAISDGEQMSTLLSRLLDGEYVPSSSGRVFSVKQIAQMFAFLVPRMNSTDLETLLKELANHLPVPQALLTAVIEKSLQVCLDTGVIHTCDGDRRCLRCDKQLCRQCIQCVFKDCKIVDAPMDIARHDRKDSLAAKRLVSTCHRMCGLSLDKITTKPCACLPNLMAPGHSCEVDSEFHFCAGCIGEVRTYLATPNVKPVTFTTKTYGREILYQYICQDGHAAAYDGVRICVFCGGWAFPFRINELNLPSGFKVNWNEGNPIDWDDGLSPWFLKTVTSISLPAPIKKKSLMDSQDCVLEDDEDLGVLYAGSEFSWTSAELRDVGGWGTK